MKTDNRRDPSASHRLDLEILPQPNDETCGPTCLHAVYRYWGEDVSLPEVIETTPVLEGADPETSGGTLAVLLGIHALRRGYRATLYTFNLSIFDPTWFAADGNASPEVLPAKLRAQADAKSVDDPRFRIATEAYLEFLQRGGSIAFEDLSGQLISQFIENGRPILTGLSATYLYRCAREHPQTFCYDDVAGEPSGHFVVLHGYDANAREVTVADPLAENPGFDAHNYTVSMNRLVPAIMLGVMTYDANLLIIEPISNQPDETPDG